MSEVEPATTAATVHERAVIDAFPRAVVVTDASGTITLWNEAAERLFGWSEDAVLGRSVLDVLTPAEHVDEARLRLALISAGNPLSGDRWVRSQDGVVRRVLTFSRPVLDDAGGVLAIVATFEDVTELRRAEQRTRDLTEQLHLAAEAGGLGTWRWDIATGTTRWDDRLEALFGLPPGGFDGAFSSYVELLHPDDRERVLQVVQGAVKTNSGYRVEHRVVRPDGSVRWLSAAGGVTIDDAGRVTGTVGCAIDATDRVSRELERERLATLAVEAAAKERVQRERLEFLSAINDALNHSFTVREIMTSVTSQAVPRLGDWCSIHVLPRPESLIPDVEVAHADPEMVAYARQLQNRFPYDPNAPSGVASVIRTGRTLFYPDITEDVIAELSSTEDERAIIAQLALRSAIAVPLIKHGRILGAMQFVMSSSSRRYTEDDVVLAETVAGRIASSLEYRRLDDAQRLIAHTLQQSLLPRSLPTVPGIDIAVRYWAAGEAAEVGGDFYDVFCLGADTAWAVVIGDVCGTGPAAAALTGLARHSIRDSAWHGDSPVEVLNSLNRAVCRSDTGSFLTAAYATLDTSGSHPELTLICGGHPLPIQVTADGARTIGIPGTLIGVFDRGRFHPQSTTLHAGDIIVFYTDGATDVAPPWQLDEAQLTALVERAATGGGDAAEIADRIHRSLEEILSFDRRDDDIALMILHVT